MTASSHFLTDDEKYVLERACQDPVWWCRMYLGHSLWSKQIQIIESVRDNPVTAVKSCHGAGKSFCAADTTLWFLYTHYPSIVITTAPTDRQVKGILWKEIRTSFQTARALLSRNPKISQQELKLDENWFAMGFTAREYDPDRFQGFHAESILVVVDEASGVSNEIFEGIQGILASEHSRLLMIGNPTNPLGEFARAFKKTRVEKITISAFDTPNFTKFGIGHENILDNSWEEKITGPLPAPYLITPQWVADRARSGDWGANSVQYQTKILAQFPSASADTLIPLHLIEAAVNRAVPFGQPRELGVDCARHGTDESVIMFRAGSVARIHQVIPTCSTMELAGFVIVALKETSSKIAKIDSVGIGAGVFDRLNEQGLPVQEMQSGSSARDTERFANARAEWWWGLRRRFEEGDICIDDDDLLVSQLSDIRFKVNSRGQILIESKEEMKRRGQVSPDRADALMFCFAGSLLKYEEETELDEPVSFGGIAMDDREEFLRELRGEIRRGK
jgi:hypothetical protein